jgi:hypothetical protein
MAINTPWPFLESETLHRINDLGAGGNPGDHNISYSTVPKIINTHIDDAGWAPAGIQEIIVDTVIEIISLICKTDGDPRRDAYRLTSTVAHGGTLPTSLGPFGAIYDAAGGVNYPMEPRTAREIAEIRENVNNVFGSPPPVFRYYCIDGEVIYHTLSGNVTIERFDYPRPATNYTALNTLFSSLANISPIHDEFAPAVADGAASRLLAKFQSMRGQSQDFWQKYVQALQSRGLNAKLLIDYAPQGQAS